MTSAPCPSWGARDLIARRSVPLGIKPRLRRVVNGWGVYVHRPDVSLLFPWYCLATGDTPADAWHAFSRCYSITPGGQLVMLLIDQ